MRAGATLIAVGAALGLAISIYNYFSPQGLLSPLSNISHTGGALLVIISTALMLIGALVLLARIPSRLLNWLALIGILLAIVGTGFAALLLDSPPLLVAMVICAVGWLMRLFGRRRVPA